MYFRDVIGHKELKDQLIRSVEEDRISHALMFSGNEGSGTLPLALAFAGYILCENPDGNDRCGTCSSCKKVDVLGHPDLHLSFPIVIEKKVRTTERFQQEFKKVVRGNPYLDLRSWESEITETIKKSVITADESQDIIRSLSLKAFNGGYKIMIIWRADRLNPQAQNKLLKTLEEPESKTIIILTLSNPEDLLPTINSRTQSVKLSRLRDEQIAAGLVDKKQVAEGRAQLIARLADGDFGKALRLAASEHTDSPYFEVFLEWMRSSVTAKPQQLKETSSKIAGFSREQQQSFLEFGLQFLHQSVLFNFLGNEAAVFPGDNQEAGQKFAKYIVNQDLNKLHDMMSEGHYLVQRNVYSPLLFMKMGLDMMRLFNSHR